MVLCSLQKTRCDPTPRAYRIDAPCRCLGLLPPPRSIHIWPTPEQRFEAMAVSPPGRADAIGRWAYDVADAEVLVEEGLAPTTVWFRFRLPPVMWRRVVSMPGIQRIEVTTEGIASIFLEASPTEALSLAQDLEATEDTVACREVVHDPREGLTPRQRDAMFLALTLGYYDVPRRIDLRSLAARVGIGHGSLSELLRRGEHLLVAGFCDRWAETQTPT